MFLAEGFEEIEALTTVDILRRGGVDVRTVSVKGGKVVTGAHSIPVTADLDREAFEAEAGQDEVKAMVFPGGMPGTRNLAEDKDLMDRMKKHFNRNGLVAAICAAPGLVLSQVRSLEGIRFTCYDGFEQGPMSKGGIYTGEPAEVDCNVVTGRGPGCAVDFALALLAELEGQDRAVEVADGLLIA